MKDWYEKEGQQKLKDWYEEEGQKKMKELYEAHRDEILRKQKERYAVDGKEKKREWYIQNRQNRLEYATEYYKDNKIKKILKQHFHSYDSGMEYLCVSCTRLHSRGNVSKHKIDVNKAKDEKLILNSKSRNIDDNFYICGTCKPALTKGLPRMNFIKTGDFDKIGSLPNQLPDLNILESYLLKITIPFIRVSHVPRSPNLKLLGGSVCIEADINHTVRRLQINPETIIPVSFKRKLAFSGYYLEQVINKENVFLWLKFLKKNNPFYEGVEVEEINQQIDKMSSKLLKELVKFDEFRILKQNLDAKKIVEQTQITQDIDPVPCDSDDEVEIPEDILTEAIHEKEIPIHDTFLYHVNEISTDTNTVTNKIAEYITKAEAGKQNTGEDHDVADQEHFLFKDDEEENLVEELESTDFFQDFEETDRLSTTKDVKPKTKEDHTNIFVNKLTRKKKKKKSTADEKEKTTVVAPGENQKFSNSIKYQEEKCFPTLFPKGSIQ